MGVEAQGCSLSGGGVLLLALRVQLLDSSVCCLCRCAVGLLRSVGRCTQCAGAGKSLRRQAKS